MGRETDVVLTMQWRQSCYYKVLAFGRSPLGRLKLRLHLLMADLFQWLALICLAFLEFLKEPRPLMIRTPACKAEQGRKDAGALSESQTTAQVCTSQAQKKAI